MHRGAFEQIATSLLRARNEDPTRPGDLLIENELLMTARSFDSILAMMGYNSFDVLNKIKES